MRRILLNTFVLLMVACFKTPEASLAGSIIQIEKVGEIKNAFQSAIYGVYPNPASSREVFLWEEIACSEGGKRDMLVPWTMGASLEHPSRVLHSFKENEELVALGNVFNDTMEVAFAKLKPEEQEGSLIFSKATLLLGSTVSEEKGSTHQWAKKLGQALVVSANRLIGKPVRIHTLSNGDSYLLIRANSSTKLHKISQDGRLLWERVLLPELPRGRSFPFEDVLLAVSSTGNIAVSFRISISEYPYFVARDKVAPFPNKSDTSVGAVLVLDPHNGSILHTDIVEKNVNGLVWLSPTKLAVVVSDRAIKNRTANVLLIQTDAKDGKNGVVKLPLLLPAKSFQINAVVSVASNRLLIGASVDYEQVLTSSVISAGHVFMGLYDTERHEFIASERIIGKRDTSITAIAALSQDEFLLATREDAPLTHDTDVHYNAVLYRLHLRQGPAATGGIVLNARSYETVASGLLEEYKGFLGRQIELGYEYRGEQIHISNEEVTEELTEYVHNDGEKKFVRVERGSYVVANSEVRSRMQEKVLSHMGSVKAYHPVVDINRSHVSEEPILARLHSDLSAFGELVPVERLLSSFGSEWARKNSKVNGPNCFFTAIASINKGWNAPRFMSEQEFMCHLRDSFTEVDGPDQFGDLLVLFSEDGIPEHAATYVGQISNGDKILLTKNGRKPGFYLFMDLSTILGDEFLYQGSKAKFFRSIKPSLPSDCDQQEILCGMN